MRRFLRRSAWARFFALLAVIFGFGIALTVVGHGMSDHKFDVWPDIAKAGVQIAVITVAGAVVTAALKYIDQRRSLNEQRRQVFRDILAAYNEVKAVRRNLRALGLLDPGPTGQIIAQQAEELRKQMTLLNMAQLRLEAIARDLQLSEVFEDVDNVVDQLGTAEYFLSRCVLKKWEDYGGMVWEGSDVSVLVPLEFDEFIGHRRDGFFAFHKRVSTPLDNLTETLNGHLFGRRTLAEREAARSRKKRREQVETCN